MKKEFQRVVIGLGGIGSAAAYWLARRSGSEVLGLEQFEHGHSRGASSDHSRIIRLSYHTPGYVRLAAEAYRAWEAVEEEADQPLIVRTGGLDLGPRVSAVPIQDHAQSLAACGVPFEMLDSREIMRRWPQFRLTDDIHGLFQEQGGIVAAARANAAHLRLAREHGATLLDQTPVTGILSDEGSFVVETPDSAYRCEKVIIAADAWTNTLLERLGVTLPLTVTLEQVTYFAASSLPEFSPDRFPVWIWMDEPCFFGFPVFGELGVKVAQDVGGPEVDPQDRPFEPDAGALRRVHDFLERHLPSAIGPILYTKTCLYTLTPDRDFVIDALPGHPNAMVALGAAHGFKFASLIGRILSELAEDGTTRSEISPFRIDRPALREVGAVG